MVTIQKRIFKINYLINHLKPTAVKEDIIMRFRVNKIALSLATAFLMISSIVTVAMSAAGTNQLTVSSDKTNVQAGDTFNVTVGYKPDNSGVAGFTVSLHYDSSKLSVYIPTEEELESTYDVSGKFSVITNYAATDNTIKIVGANLKGSNVKQNTDIALATFTVKDGAVGDLNYWFEVETMVRATDSGYETASYSAPTQSSPYTINGPVKATTTISKETTTTTKAETTTTTATSASTTVKTSKDTEKPQTTTTAETTTAKKTTTSKETTAAEVTTTTAQQTTAETTTTQPATENSEPLFTYEQGAEDFQSDRALQYGFRLSEYITDYSKHYNIKINFNTTGNINGAIGMMVDGKWDSQSNKSYGVTQDSWTYEDLDPNSSSDLVYMQVYYMKAFSEFEITSIEVTPTDGGDTIIGAITKPAEVAPPAAETTPAVTTTIETTTTTAEETTTTAESSAEIEDSVTETKVSEQSVQTTADNAEITEESENTTTKAQESETENQSKETEVSSKEENTGAVTSVSDNSDEKTTTNVSEKEEIIKAVDSASSTAKKTVNSNENPNTGSAVKTVVNMLNVVSAAIILFSLFAVVYNKIADRADRKEDETEY